MICQRAYCFITMLTSDPPVCQRGRSSRQWELQLELLKRTGCIVLFYNPHHSTIFSIPPASRNQEKISKPRKGDYLAPVYHLCGPTATYESSRFIFFLLKHKEQVVMSGPINLLWLLLDGEYFCPRGQHNLEEKKKTPQRGATMLPLT
jgi:hypothetical protein